MTATIILLNGTSSSGKTTITKQLQQQLPTPFMHVQVDTFAEMLPEGFLENGDPELRRATGPKLISGYHRALAALAEAGNDLIVDHVIPSPKWFAECVTLFAPYRVLFVGVHCPLEELQRRELARGDRHIGLAEMQFTAVHQHGPYDVAVDTHTDSPETCVAAILAAVAGGEETAVSRFHLLPA